MSNNTKYNMIFLEMQISEKKIVNTLAIMIECYGGISCSLWCESGIYVFE